MIRDDWFCARCNMRPRGGSFVLCDGCYTLSIREGRLKTKGTKIEKPKSTNCYTPLHCRNGTSGSWDNAVRAIEDWGLVFF